MATEDSTVSPVLPNDILTLVVDVKLYAKRANGVFDGENGLIVTGVLAGLGTLFCLFVFLLTIIHVRKRMKRRKKSTAPGQSAFSKIKSRISSEAGHPVLRSETRHAQLSENGHSPNSQQTLYIPEVVTTQNQQSHSLRRPTMVQTTSAPPVLQPQSQSVAGITQTPQQQTTPARDGSKIRKSTIPFSEPPARRRKGDPSQQHQQFEDLIPQIPQYLQVHVDVSGDTDSGNDVGLGRPTSFLPYPRGLTPLSIPISSSTSPSEISGIGTRPGLSAVPSSELLHSSTENNNNNIDIIGDYDANNDDAASFVQEVRAPSVTPSSEAGTPRPRTRRPSKSSISSSMKGYQEQSTSLPLNPITVAQNARSRMLNFSYPVTVMASHVHAQSSSYQASSPTTINSMVAAHVPQNSHFSKHNSGSTNTLQHIRNRSNGTVKTYASSSFSNLSNTTARIQPVVFNDSPRSSISVNLYQPSAPYVNAKAGISTRGIGGGPPRTSHYRSASDKQSDRETLTSLRSLQSPPASAGSTTQKFKFPTPPRARKASDTGSTATSIGISSTAGSYQQSSSSVKAKRFNRRASGKLPDMLFSRQASHEDPPSPRTPSDQEDLKNTFALGGEDESVLDPIDDVMRSYGISKAPYQDMRFSTSTIASLDGNDADLKEFKAVGGRPALEHSNPSTSSLMTSTSSTATSSSNYGMAV